MYLSICVLTSSPFRVNRNLMANVFFLLREIFYTALVISTMPSGVMSVTRQV